MVLPLRPTPGDRYPRGLPFFCPEEPRTLREFEAAVRESERRTIQKQQMAVLKERRGREQKPSIWQDIADNAWIVAIAVLGAVVSSIPLFKRPE